MSRLTITLGNADDLIALLSATDQEVERARKNALRRTATAFRRVLVAQIQAGTGIKAKTLRDNLVIYNPGGRYQDARILPKGSGIPVSQYLWRFVPLQGSPTRGQIYVRWFGGEKLAAGFVNPKGEGKVPLRTYSRRERGPGSRPGKAKPVYHYPTAKPVRALGPSVATAVRKVATEPLLAEAQQTLARLFEESLFKQVSQHDQGD